MLVPSCTCIIHTIWLIDWLIFCSDFFFLSFLGFLVSASVKLEEGISNPLQYSYLKNPMERGAWQATVHSVSESDMTKVT